MFRRHLAIARFPLTRPYASRQQAPPSILLQSQTRTYIEQDEDDDEYLDISEYGSYNLVLPEDPHREGVGHITPAIVPPHITRPRYASNRLTPGDPTGWQASNSNPDMFHPWLKRNISGRTLSELRRRMKISGAIAAGALLEAGKLIKVSTVRMCDRLSHAEHLRLAFLPARHLDESFE